MPDQFEQYYKYLKSNGADVAPDFNSFKNTLSNPNESSKYYTYLKDNNFDVPETYDSFADTFGLKKKDGTVVSGPTPSKLPSQDYLREGEKMAKVGFATPQLISEDVKARKEQKIRISPKLFAAPGLVDVDIVEADDDGSYKNLAQNLANNFLISGSEIGAGLAEILREGPVTGVPQEKKKTEALYTPEGEKTKYAKDITWAQDPLGRVALGLNGIAQPAKELQETASANLPDTFLGNTLTSLSAIVPDIAATALMPEAKAVQGASFLQKTGSLLFNNFTKYLMVKEPLVDYNRAKLEGKDQSALDVISNVGKGALSGMELALLGAGSSLATKATMKQAAKIGLVGAKGFAAKELVNLATDVVAYGLISPSAHTLYEEGRLPTSKEISEGAGIALAFRLKEVIPSTINFRDLNKAVDNIQQAKQGAALYNFLQATPESIIKVYNGKESANELHLKAMVAAKEAKDAVDPVEKQKAVIKASTMAKAANVKQMADMFVQDRTLVDYVKNNEDLPIEARNAISEKANLIRKAVDPVEIQKEQAGQRMQQGQRFIQDLTLEINSEQDPVKKAELKFRIDQTEKGLKMQENQLMSLIESQSKEYPLDFTDVNTVKESKKAFNEQMDLKLQALDKGDPDYFEKVENFNKQKEERNDYFDRIIENKDQESKGANIITPEEMNQIDATEISIEPRIQEVEAPVEEVKPIEVEKQTEVVESGNDLILSHGTRHDFDKFQLEKIGTGEGAQAFGYGLYFTDGSKIAEGYAKKLSEDNTGLVYSVKIKNGKLANWAEWRRPLDENIESSFYNKLTKEEKAQYQNYVDNQFNSGKDKNYTGSFGDLELSKEGFLEYPTFEKPSASGNLYQDLKAAFGQEKATEIFKRAGIDGIKYESQGGYGNENNYVVFNPESIEIIKKSKGGAEVKPTEEAKSLQKSSEKIQDILGLPEKESYILSLIYNSSNTGAEKKMLYRQYKRGVMRVEDIEKYTTIDAKKLASGDLDRWVKAILKNNQGNKSKINVESIDFEELPKIKTEEVKPTEVKEEPKKTYQEVLKEKQEAERKLNRQIGAEKAVVTKELYRKVKEMPAPAGSGEIGAVEVALRYLADGGKVSEEAVNDAYGSVKGAELNVPRRKKISEEVKLKDFVGGNETLNDLAHRLWEVNKQRISERDIKDKLIAEIGNNNTRIEAAEAYLEQYSPEYMAEKQAMRIAEQYEAEFLEEQEKLEKQLREPLDEQIEGEDSEDHINNLIKQIKFYFIKYL